MTQGMDQDKLEIIIGYLQQQRTALATLDLRMDSLSIDLKVACDSMRSVVERQTVMERDSNNRSANCYAVMNAMGNRIAALEQMLTPIPGPFDPRSLDDTSENVSARDPGGNGVGAKAVPCVEEELCESNDCYEDDPNGSDDE